MKYLDEELVELNFEDPLFLTERERVQYEFLKLKVLLPVERSLMAREDRVARGLRERWDREHLKSRIKREREANIERERTKKIWADFTGGKIDPSDLWTIISVRKFN